MSVAPDELHRFGLKIFFAPDAAPDPGACIPVFHRWIRERALEGVLIDVADYTHLADGPSVLLVGHEGNLSLDLFEQRAGLFYTRKRPSSDSFHTRLTSTARTLFSACQLLEDDPVFSGGVRFKGNELQFVANDRLVASPDEATARQLGEHLGPLVKTLYPETQCEVTTISQGKDRLRLSVKTATDVPIRTLLSRTS